MISVPWKTVVAAAPFMVSLAALAVSVASVFINVANSKVDRRAWIGAPVITAWVDAAEGVQRFTLSFKNVGKTPALGSYVGAELLTKPDVEDMNPEDWEPVMRKHCARGQSQSAQDIRRFAIFPSDQIEFQGDTPGREIHLIRPVSSYAAVGTQHPHIIGCITYITDDGKRRHTGFAAPLIVENGIVAVGSVLAVRPE